MYLIADIGSTTTKTFLFTSNGKLLGSASASTTVEKPFEDVNIGLFNAIKILQKRSGLSLMADPSHLHKDIRLFATSSAGGGLQMVVIGLTNLYSAKLGHKAALGAGAIITDIICGGDGRDPEEKIQTLRNVSPDMILFCGGVDCENISNICKYAELIQEARVKNKYKNQTIPIVYSGNKNAFSEIKNILKGYPLFSTDNIFCNLKLSNDKQLQKKVIKIFFQHVMEDAPGYKRLKKKVSYNILPTPIAVNKTMKILDDRKKNILIFDIGGATTDIFTIYRGSYFRSVSANIGMSYSINNVLEQVGIRQIKKYLNHDISNEKIFNYIGNKHIHPNSIPKNKNEKAIEEAVAINAIQIAYKNHLKLYNEEFNNLQENNSKKNFQDFFRSYLQTPKFDIVIGSGGIVSKNPNLNSRQRILKSAFPHLNPEKIFIDDGFMFPHIGVLSQSYPLLAKKILESYSLQKVEEQRKRPFHKTYIVLPQVTDNRLVIKEKPIVKINNPGELNILKTTGQQIRREDILAEKVQKYYRKFYLPIPQNKNIIFKSNKIYLEKYDPIITLKLSKRTHKKIRAPFPCKLIDIKKYVIIIQENDANDLKKVKLSTQGVSKKKVKKRISELYDNKIIDRNFRFKDIIIDYAELHNFVASPISGKVIEYDEENAEILLKRMKIRETIKTYASGIIDKINSDSVEIKSDGFILHGKIGMGVSRIIRDISSILWIKNKIYFENFLELDYQVGFAFNLPYSDYRRFCKQNNKKSLIVFGNFDTYDFNTEFQNLKNILSDNYIYISPKTRIRAGVERPFVYWEK